jgi:hypothetical protein
MRPQSRFNFEGSFISSETVHAFVCTTLKQSLGNGWDVTTGITVARA